MHKNIKDDWCIAPVNQNVYISIAANLSMIAWEINRWIVFRSLYN